MSLILRPDRRRCAQIGHVISFNHLKIGDLPDTDSDAPASMPREELGQRPEVASPLADAEVQLAGYRRTLEGLNGDRLMRRACALICSGMAGFVW